MPKFLDRPSWYSSNGTMTYGVGIPSTTPTDGTIPVYRNAAGDFTAISPTISGLHLTDVSAWYAPIVAPGSPARLVYSDATNIPKWTAAPPGTANIPYTFPSGINWLGAGESGAFLMTKGTADAPRWIKCIASGTYTGTGTLSNIVSDSNDEVRDSLYILFPLLATDSLNVAGQGGFLLMIGFKTTTGNYVSLYTDATGDWNITSGGGTRVGSNRGASGQLQYFIFRGTATK